MPAVCAVAQSQRALFRLVEVNIKLHFSVLRGSVCSHRRNSRSFEIVSLLNVSRRNARTSERGNGGRQRRRGERVGSGWFAWKMSRDRMAVSATVPYRSRCRYQGAGGSGKLYSYWPLRAVIGLPLTTAIRGPISWLIFI